MDCSNTRIITVALVIAVLTPAGFSSAKNVKSDSGLEQVKSRILSVDQIPASAYPRIHKGHLWVNGSRLKLWGSQGNLGKKPEEIDKEVRRFRKLGFNLYRSINVTNIIEPEDFDYTPGDGSRMDWQDYTFAEIARSGGYNWVDVINGFRIRSRYADIAIDPYISKEEWVESIEAMEKAGGKGIRNLQAWSGIMYWDKRARAAYMMYLDKMMTHRNPYNGLRYCEDPSFVGIELMNEQWWIPRSLGGSLFVNLPDPLIRSLLDQWNQWLIEKYTDTKGLIKGWGQLREDESLEAKTVLLQPLQGEAAADEMSSVLGISPDYDEQAQKAVPQSEARKRDVIHFLMDIHLDFCKEAAAKVRSYGKNGKGAAVVPILFDTGASYAMPSQYEHTYGSALACATYVHQIDPDRSKPTFPWRTFLKEPPAFNSWINHNRLENVPTFIYEIMFFNPGKYRADFALRLLSLATIQDFDVIDWHYYFPYNIVEDEPLRMPTPDHYWNSVVYSHDEVALAAMFLASNIFRYGDLKPPEDPTILAMNEDFVFDMANLRWGRFASMLSPTVFQYGLRLRFDLDRPESGFIGPYSDGTDVPAVVKPTPQIRYHWKDGYMVIESERVLLVAGFLPPEFNFSSGETLKDISINIPEGTPYMIDNERYVCFALCSRDLKPLNKSKDIVAMAVNTSWNTDFKFDIDKWIKLQEEKNHPPLNASLSVDRGTTPILVSRVGWTLDAKWLKGMSAKHYDFELDVYKQQNISSGTYTIEDTEKLFYVELTKD